MVETNKRDFKGVWIPKEIWLDERLSMVEKGVLTEINSLDQEETGCFASNEDLATFCQCSIATITRAIAKLKQLDYIYEKSFNGRKRILKCRPSVPNHFDEADYAKRRPSNTFNKTIINKEENIKEESQEIITYLNSAISASYKYQSAITQKHIKARLNEGYTVEDFKTVIDKKVAEWKGTEMAQYLRPETLFGSKFESYLNAPQTTAKKACTHFENERQYTKAEMDALITNIDDIDF